MSILDDNIIEGARTFNVVLTTDNELVTVGDPATVNVTDDDCKCKLSFINIPGNFQWAQFSCIMMRFSTSFRTEQLQYNYVYSVT